MTQQPEQVDVLICGGGSAGLCAGLWLARTGIDYRILERRAGPLERGQADGVQCRTVEIFESFGLAEELLKAAYHALEIAFWSGDSGGGIRRTHYAADTEAGLSHLPHVILNQAEVNRMMTEEMRRASGRENIVYGCEVRGLEVDGALAHRWDDYCVRVTASKDGAEKVYRAKYVLGCDGAHSLVRKSLGFNMIGDSTDSVWGVMDVYPRTNFPDIRKKCMLSSETGNLIIIPREGDLLVRFYLELQGATAKDVTLGELQEKARLCFRPYTMEIAETSWWSAYSIGQRLADFFHKEYRVFLTGDACHTHSPKAGQGMNVSLQDGYNIGWKLAAVLRKQANPELLETYVSERQKTATDLIDFDRYWTKLFSTSFRQENGITPEQFHEAFVKAGRYTSGQAIKYTNSIITSSSSSDHLLATGVEVGMRFPSAQVVRFCDARSLQLVKALPADSRWHIVIFGGDICDESVSRRLQKVREHLLSNDFEHVIRHFTPPGSDFDSVIHPILFLSSKRIDVEQEQIPELFTPITGKWKMRSLFNVFVDDEGYNNSGHGHAYEVYGVDSSRGALVIVRPDHYVAKISSLEDTGAVDVFFSVFLNKWDN
ncbi:FAD binding domain-containing protein [Whalleya microplaca]|nr:FAD binding domain-containing protein [Whalleya microplaca]